MGTAGENDGDASAQAGKRVGHVALGRERSTSATLRNFTWLVLGCIEAYFCNQIAKIATSAVAPSPRPLSPVS